MHDQDVEALPPKATPDANDVSHPVGDLVPAAFLVRTPAPRFGLDLDAQFAERGQELARDFG